MLLNQENLCRNVTVLWLQPFCMFKVGISFAPHFGEQRGTITLDEAKTHLERFRL